MSLYESSEGSSIKMSERGVAEGKVMAMVNFPHVWKVYSGWQRTEFVQFFGVVGYFSAACAVSYHVTFVLHYAIVVLILFEYSHGVFTW